MVITTGHGISPAHLLVADGPGLRSALCTLHFCQAMEKVVKCGRCDLLQYRVLKVPADDRMQLTGK